MAAETRTYTGISRGAMDGLRKSLERYVTLPEGDSGTLTSNGMTGSFTYDEGRQRLDLTITSFPMLLPRNMIWKAVDGAIADAKR